jgi:hypothetical protein
MVFFKQTANAVSIERRAQAGTMPRPEITDAAKTTPNGSWRELLIDDDDNQSATYNRSVIDALNEACDMDQRTKQKRKYLLNAGKVKAKEAEKQAKRAEEDKQIAEYVSVSIAIIRNPKACSVCRNS